MWMGRSGYCGALEDCAIAPLVGVLDNGTPVPMAAIMVATTGLAAILLLSVRKELLGYDYA